MTKAACNSVRSSNNSLRDAKLILTKEIRHTIIQTAPEVLELEG